MKSHKLLNFSIFIILLFSFLHYANNYELRNLSNTSTVSRYPAITADKAGNVHVVWVEETESDGYEGMIYYTMWDGENWTQPVDVYYSWQLLTPDITVDAQGMIHLVVLSAGQTIYLHAQVQNNPSSAKNWSEPVVVDDGHHGFNHWPHIIAASDGKIHVTYTVQERYVNLITSDDDGTNWFIPLLLSDPDELSAVTSNTLAEDGDGVLYATWGEGRDSTSSTHSKRVLFARSEDGGETWSGSLLLSDPDESVLSEPLSIFVDRNDRLHLIWRNHDVQMVHQWSDDQGRTWSSPQVINSSVSKLSLDHAYSGISVVVDSANAIHLFYVWQRDLYHQVYDQGSWSAPRVVAQPMGSDASVVKPRAAVSDGNQLHVVFYNGYPELVIPDQQRRLAEGQYEIFLSQMRVPAPEQPAIPFPTLTPQPTPTPRGITPTPTATLVPLNPQPEEFGIAVIRPASLIGFSLLTSLIVISIIVVIKVIILRSHNI